MYSSLLCSSVAKAHIAAAMDSRRLQELRDVYAKLSHQSTGPDVAAAAAAAAAVAASAAGLGGRRNNNAAQSTLDASIVGNVAPFPSDCSTSSSGREAPRTSRIGSIKAAATISSSGGARVGGDGDGGNGGGGGALGVRNDTSSTAAASSIAASTAAAGASTASSAASTAFSAASSAAAPAHQNGEATCPDVVEARLLRRGSGVGNGGGRSMLKRGSSFGEQQTSSGGVAVGLGGAGGSGGGVGKRRRKSKRGERNKFYPRSYFEWTDELMVSVGAVCCVESFTRARVVLVEPLLSTKIYR